MIQRLSIRNFVLIDDLDLTLERKFTAITGETGAGKSILLEALSLILGKRGGTEFLKDSSVKCVLEADFNLVNFPSLQTLFEELDLDFEFLTCIRREIAPNGRSRLFLNDTPVTQESLRKISPFLVDIHSQDDQSLIKQNAFWMELLDSQANQIQKIEIYAKCYNTYQIKRKELADLKTQIEQAEKDRDYKQYLWEELEATQIKGVTELTDLEQTQQRLASREEIQQAVQKINALAHEEQIGVLDRLSEIRQTMGQISNRVESYQDLQEKFTSIFEEFKAWLPTVDFMAQDEDEETDIETINQRLVLFYDLFKKHKVENLAELMEVKVKLESELNILSEGTNSITNLEEEIASLEVELWEQAGQISDARKEISVELVQSVKAVLVDLAMPNANLILEFQKSEVLLPKGQDQLSVLVQTNVGSPIGELSKVASGGEKSRFIFALKKIIAERSHLPSILFDEIDIGISGKVSESLGKMMREMSTSTQVISITHSPQVASRAQHHLWVHKKTQDNRTSTHIKTLTTDQRITEIAGMISGEEFSEHALKHAQELLGL